MDNLQKDTTQDKFEKFSRNNLRSSRKQRNIKQTVMAAKLNIDQSYLSRIENGKRKPKNIYQAQRIVDEYGLETNIGNEYISIFREVSSEIDIWNCSVVDVFQDRLDTIYQLRVQGNPAMAIQEAHITANRIRQITYSPSETTSLEYIALRNILANVLYQQMVAYTETKEPKELLIIALGISKEMESIAKEIKSEELLGLAYQRKGAALYIAKEYAGAAKLMNKALKYVKDANNKLWTLHSLAVNYGLMKNSDEFTRVENQITELIETDKTINQELVCYAFERLGRGRGFLQRSDVYDAFDKAENVYNELRKRQNKLTLRGIQLIRSKLDVMAELRTKDIIYAEKLAQKGVILAEEAGYLRHAKEIKASLAAIVA